jgi:hypothetical protein
VREGKGGCQAPYGTPCPTKRAVLMTRGGLLTTASSSTGRNPLRGWPPLALDHEQDTEAQAIVLPAE